jgi:mono/diheme cytochrome c family protein
LNQPQGISPPSARALVAGNGQSGKLLYTKYGCYDCHGRYGEGSTATGPRLNPIPVSLESLVSYLRHPAGDMPPYTDKVVSDSELADIFAFLQSLPAPPKAENIPSLQ